MKKVLFLILFISCFMVNRAQDCSSPFFPETKDVQLEYTQYNKSDKVIGSTVQKISNIEQDVNSIKATVEVESFDDKGKSMGSVEIGFRCENGIYYVNMENYLMQETLQSMEGMEMSIEGGSLELPSDLKAGDELKGGEMTLTMSAGGIKIMTITVDVSNRKVEAVENVTTPAGTFECYKISYDITTKVMGTTNTRGVEWYAKNVGLVKSETYDSKDRLQGYTILTAFEQ